MREKEAINKQIGGAVTLQTCTREILGSKLGLATAMNQYLQENAGILLSLDYNCFIPISSNSLLTNHPTRDTESVENRRSRRSWKCEEHNFFPLPSRFNMHISFTVLQLNSVIKICQALINHKTEAVQTGVREFLTGFWKMMDEMITDISLSSSILSRLPFLVPYFFRSFSYMFSLAVCSFRNTITSRTLVVILSGVRPSLLVLRPVLAECTSPR
jgi:hypothetical protein